MSDYFLLAMAIALAIPYAYLMIAVIAIQPRRISSYVSAGLMLFFWPFCIFMSFLQLIPIAVMSLWWWLGDFSGNPDLSLENVRKRRIPKGLKILLPVMIIASMAAGLFAWLTFAVENSG
jgi:hypothetical protein